MNEVSGFDRKDTNIVGVVDYIHTNIHFKRIIFFKKYWISIYSFFYIRLGDIFRKKDYSIIWRNKKNINEKFRSKRRDGVLSLWSQFQYCQVIIGVGVAMIRFPLITFLYLKKKKKKKINPS